MGLSRKRPAHVAWEDTLGRWVCLQTSGQGPSPRSGHDVVVIGRKAYLFGGCGGESNDQIACLNDVYTFDLDTHQWNAVAVNGEPPLPRASFGMCARPSPHRSIVVAGGTGVEMDSLRADIVEFDTRTRAWRRVVTDSEETPCRFYGQSLCTYGESLLLFGGSTGMHYTNDLYEYNTTTQRWRKLTTTGRKPTPRYKHQAVIVGASMYVIGGGCFKPEQSTIDVHRLDLATLAWDEVATSGDVPKSRVAHSCCYDAGTGTIFLWGGFTSELSRLQDFYTLHCETATWRAAAALAPAVVSGVVPAAAAAAAAAALPPARAFHAACFFEDALYVFSGANGDVRYSDVWRYQACASPPSLGVLAARLVRAAAAAEGGGDADAAAAAAAAARHKRHLPSEVADAVLHFNQHAMGLAT
ncbi:hypothetical protein JKP88DRAFT_164369 [Tribonema minus]|uniref:Uncharacterized protein n=1 Tax=Tribonema minus TaxID=303371 RepID=A0A836CEB6_9STRA|nr:hypothetical protein JKP88DRAFT_164369 [Tribonema minus]